MSFGSQSKNKYNNRPNHSNQGHRKKTDMDLNWRKDGIPKSELSSSAWQNSQSFITEQDLLYRKEMDKRMALLEKEMNAQRSLINTEKNNSSVLSLVEQHKLSSKKDTQQSNTFPVNNDDSPYINNSSNNEFKLMYHQHHPKHHSSRKNNQSGTNYNNRDINNNYGGNSAGSRIKHNQGNRQFGRQQHHRRNIHPDDRHSKGAKLFFYPFMDRSMALKKVEHGQLYTGQLRINHRKRIEAYATSEELDDDVFIYGLTTRNRALEGDTVIVQLVDLEEVLEKKSRNEQRRREQQTSSKQQSSNEKSSHQNNEGDDQLQTNDQVLIPESEDNLTNDNNTSMSGNGNVEPSESIDDENLINSDKNNVEEEIEDDVETTNDNECDDNVTTVASLVEDDSTNVKDTDPIMDQEVDDNVPLKQRYAGKVVHILSRYQDSFSGILSIDYPLSSAAESEVVITTTETTEATETKQENQNDENKKYIWFRPTDLRVPFMRVEITDATNDIFKNPDFYKNNLVEVLFLRWPITSKYPYGEVIKHLGPIGSMITEEQAILSDYSIRDGLFDNIITQSVSEISRDIPTFEYKCRRDLRNEIVYTIDPTSAKDLDDALHIKRLDDGTFEVGVHIADVSYYVKKHTPLDNEAKKRGTTTYLVGRSIPMLPTLLCEKICSLTPLSDKLTFSVIWKLDNDGNVLNTWFGRTVIRSCAKLSYDDAQNVIEGGHIPDSAIVYNVKKSEIEANILDIYQLSVKMRQKRFENGALSMNSVKLQFTLNELNEPDEVNVYVSKEANKLVEEFMLLANISVAEKIGKTFPETALLRRHEPPIERRLEEFLKTTMELGYEFDGSSAATLQESFNNLDDQDVKEVLLTMAIQPMKRAKYFTAGTLKTNKYLHYALNVGYYTHFTSPIRRYADIIVHRQLAASLSGQDDCGYTKKTVQSIALNCNQRKDAAKNAQDANIVLHLVNYLEKLSEKDGPIVEEAIVININKKAFDVYVPKYGIEYHVTLNNLPLQKSFYDDRRLILQWHNKIAATHERAMESYLQKKHNNNNNKDDEDEDDNDGNNADDDDKHNNEKVDNDMEQLMHELSILDTTKEVSMNTPRCIHPSIINNDKCTQIIDILTKVNVNLFPVKSRIPSQIHVYPINPF